MNRFGARWAGDEDDARRALAGQRRSARDEAGLGWSPRGDGAAGSDRSGGEDEVTKKKAWQLLDPVGEEGGKDREEEN